MNANIRCLIKACQALNITYQILHKSENLVLVANKYIFTNWATPLITHAESRLLTDKEYTQTFFSDVVRMPKIKAYLTPNIDPNLTPQKYFTATENIVEDFESEFTYPLIIKKNSGTHGDGVFLVQNRQEANEALKSIFNEKNKDWDFVALVQEYIRTKNEFRAITLNGKIEILYLKDNSKATFSGNLSPLHWLDSKARLCTDPQLIRQLENFVQPIFQKFSLAYCGIDILQDQQNNFWMLEINGSPGMDFFCRDNGDDRVVELYKKILNKIQSN